MVSVSKFHSFGRIASCPPHACCRSSACANAMALCMVMYNTHRCLLPSMPHTHLCRALSFRAMCMFFCCFIVLSISLTDLPLTPVRIAYERVAHCQHRWACNAAWKLHVFSERIVDHRRNCHCTEDIRPAQASRYQQVI